MKKTTSIILLIIGLVMLISIVKIATIQFPTLTDWGKEEKKSELYNQWLASLDSAESKQTTEPIKLLCKIGRSLEEITVEEREIRSSDFKNGKRDFDLAICFDTIPNKTTLAYFATGTEVITICDAENEENFGQKGVWVSKALVLLHELSHKLTAYTGENFILGADATHKAIEKIEFDFLNSVVPGIRDTIALNLLGAEKHQDPYGQTLKYITKTVGQHPGRAFEQKFLEIYSEELDIVNNELEEEIRLLKQQIELEVKLNERLRK